MKTIKLNFAGVKRVITLLIATSFVIMSNAQVTPTKNKIGLDHIGVMSSISGNGFGLTYSPQIGIKLTDKMVVTAGPVLKADKPHYAGYKVQGNLTLLNAENSHSNKTGLYAFIGFEKIDKQYFGKNWLEMEELTSRDNSSKGFEFSKVRFKGFELSTGFALNYKVTKNFSLNSELGLAVYKTKRLNYGDLKLYHEPIGFVLHMSLSARINISKK